MLPSFEDDREYQEPQPVFLAYCEVCSKDIHLGDRVLIDKSFACKTGYFCLDCFEKADKKTVAEWFGGSFGEAI